MWKKQANIHLVTLAQDNTNLKSFGSIFENENKVHTILCSFIISSVDNSTIQQFNNSTIQQFNISTILIQYVIIPGFIDIRAFSTPGTIDPDPITVREKSRSLSKAPPCGPPLASNGRPKYPIV